MTFTNLEKAAFSEKLYITTKTESLLVVGESEAYTLSMPLLISAQLGNAALYQRSLIRMNKTMEQVESSPFKAWLYGRILFAAQSMNDKNTETKIQNILSILLGSLTKEDSTRFDRFTVWAFGYIAALNQDEFRKAATPMTEGANNLTKEYFKINSSNASDEKKQASRSDALWAWVMISQAAANAKEKDLYEKAVGQMMTITQQSTIGDSLSKGLLRTAASNDYPAWAIAIVHLAAQTIGDEIRYNELDAFLSTSISEAKDSDKTEETLLAMVNSQLAITRQHEIEQCASSKSTPTF